MAINPIQAQKFLGGVDYPCTKDELVRHAKKRGADENVLKTLRKLPDEKFQTPAEVSQAIGAEK